MNPVSMWKGMDESDRYFFLASVITPLLVWYCYKGRKYSLRGMKNG